MRDQPILPGDMTATVSPKGVSKNTWDVYWESLLKSQQQPPFATSEETITRRNNPYKNDKYSTGSLQKEVKDMFKVPSEFKKKNIAIQ